jgi:hypothetical protein
MSQSAPSLELGAPVVGAPADLPPPGAVDTSAAGLPSRLISGLPVSSDPVVRGVEEDVQLFVSLSFLSDAQKDALVPLVRQHAQRWRTASIQHALGLAGVLFVLEWLGVTGWLLGWPATAWGLLPFAAGGVPSGGARWLFGVVLVASSMLLMAVVGAMPGGSNAQIMGFPRGKPAAFFFVLGTVAGAAWFASWTDTGWLRVSAGALALGAGIVAVLQLAGTLLAWVLMTRAISRHADSFLIDRLIYAAWLIDRVEHPWTELGRKERVASILEEAASTFQRQVAGRLRTVETVSDVWVKEEAARVAAGIREMKQWVCFPTERTYGQLMRRLATDIPAAITGRWDDLTTAEPPRLTRAQLRHKAVSLAQAVVQAVLPLVLLALLQLSPLKLPPEAVRNGYLIAFTIGALILVLRVDPHVGERLSASAGLLKALGGAKGD